MCEEINKDKSVPPELVNPWTIPVIERKNILAELFILSNILETTKI